MIRNKICFKQSAIIKTEMNSKPGFLIRSVIFFVLPAFLAIAQDSCTQPPFPRALGGTPLISGVISETSISQIDLHPTLNMLVTGGQTNDSTLLNITTGNALVNKVPFLAAYQGTKLFPMWKKAFTALPDYQMPQVKISANGSYAVAMVYSPSEGNTLIIIVRGIDGIVYRVITSSKQQLGRTSNLRKTILLSQDVLYLASTITGAANGKPQAIFLFMNINRDEPNPIYVRTFSGIAQATQVKWSKEIAGSLSSEALAACFGASDLNLNFFLQGTSIGESFNIFYNIIMPNATGPPST
jgi:hypothetical protein